MSATHPDVGELREVIADDTLLVFVSDVHIGGADGSDIFESPGELEALIRDAGRHAGPVELVLAGDFLDLLRLGDPDHRGEAADHVAATLHRPEYRDLFATLRAFAAEPGHRVTYLPGNHDAEMWSNPGVRRALAEAGLVDRFALSYAAAFASTPERLVYCEHGNQFDPANALVDYDNPLDTPLGSHIVTDMVRPIGSGLPITERIDLRNVSFVFPLMAIPEWIAGRIFYQILSRLLRWLVVGVVVAVVVAALAAAVWGVDDTLGAGGTVLAEAAIAAAVLIFVFALFFLLSRSAMEHAGRFWFQDAQHRVAEHRHGRAERERTERSIRDTIAEDRPLPLASSVTGGEIAVFVSGHTHAPGLTPVTRPDGRQMVIVNTGCWLRQLQPVRAWLGAPAVYVPTFVRTHVRVRLGSGADPESGRVTVELWNHPSRAERKLLWVERAAIVRRLPGEPDTDAGPALVARHELPDSEAAEKPTPITSHGAKPEQFGRRRGAEGPRM
jgi:UDP-2,3-diacylglucosamine pyrophosphatase LpxH